MVWFQGCSLACAGCFNPESHASHGPYAEVSSLVDRIASLGEGLEGITVSGGEPLQQPDALLELLVGVRERMPRLSAIAFSGFGREEIERQPLGSEILSRLDVLIAGRYQARQHQARDLLGSSNQTYHFLTNRYRLRDLVELPEIEAHVMGDGGVVLTGVGVGNAAWSGATGGRRRL